MSLINRLQRRFGRFAVPHLTAIILVGQGIFYVAQLLPQGLSLEQIALDPGLVMDGEVWRLATFMFTPPADRTLFVVFYFLLLLLFGTTLEREWGDFRFNLFVLTGYVANVAAAFIAWAVIAQQLGSDDGFRVFASNEFFYGSLFLAFARLYPDFIINLFFILPIRIKWLALLAWIGYAAALITGNTMTRMLVLATIANYLLFFGREHYREWRMGSRRRTFQSRAKTAAKAPIHQCVVCGLNSSDAPRTLFRYCSKCAGQRCYCPEHIQDHEHVLEE